MTTAGSAITGRFDFGFFVSLELRGKKCVLDWCKSMKLISSEYKCPNCKSQMIMEERADDIDGYVWVCRQEGENEHFIEKSVREDTFFQQSNLSIIQILLMTYLWIKKASSEFIEDELDVTKEIVEEWVTYCREICVEICLSKNSTLGGEDTLVEISECKFQEKKFKKSDYSAGGWAYVGFEKETDKCFIEIVKKKSVKQLAKTIEKNILPGTILISDCWKLYDCLDEEEFIDLKENFKIKFEHFGVGLGSLMIGLRRGVKRSLSDVPHINRDFDVYIAEYIWRRTQSDYPYDLIRSFLEEIVALFPQDVKDSEEVCEEETNE